MIFRPGLLGKLFSFPGYYLYLIPGISLFTIINNFGNNVLVAVYDLLLILTMMLAVDFACHVMQYFRVVVSNPSAEEVITGEYFCIPSDWCI